MLRILILLFFIFCLSGCVFAPGMKIQHPPDSILAKHIQPELHFIPIDVNLVKQFKQHGMDYQDDGYYYHIGAHDVLNIHVWNHPELSGPMGPGIQESGTGGGTTVSSTMTAVGYLVAPDGSIYFPLAGTVSVEGQTVQQCRVTLAHLLKTYIRNPQIDVRVIGFRSKKIYVIGEVIKPGIFPLTDSPMTITEALNLAGGLDAKTSDPSHIFIIRGDYAHPDVFWLNASSPDALLLGQDFRLKNRDVVFVSTAPVARWNRAIDQILPSIQTVWFTYSIIKNIKN